MKILIIGGTGNIFSTATTRSLADQGNEVVLYNRGRIIMEGIRHIKGNRKDHVLFERQMAEEKYFDCVIDMICFAPEDAMSIVRAFKGKIGQYIFCSTTDVYTKPSKHYPVKENEERNPSPSITYTYSYAHNKVLCEKIFEEAGERGDFAVTILRPGGTYNESIQPVPMFGTAMNLLKRIRRSKSVIILGNGNHFFVCSHRDDVGKVFAAAVGNVKTFGKSYNVSGDETMTWKEYYQTIARVMRVDLKPVYIPTDILCRISPKSAVWCEYISFNNLYDNNAAKKDLGYKYTVTWEEGLRQMIAYQDARGNIDRYPDYPFHDMIIDRWEKMSEVLAGELSPIDE